MEEVLENKCQKLRARIAAERSNREGRFAFSNALKDDILKFARQYRNPTAAGRALGISPSLMCVWIKNSDIGVPAPKRLLVCDVTEEMPAKNGISVKQVAGLSAASSFNATLPNGVVISGLSFNQDTLRMLKEI
jgi:hypothetical protein